MGTPTTEHIIYKLKMILDGKLEREEVSDWASEYVMQDQPNITDEKLWELLCIWY
ncbi:hypothetical protein NQ117_03445 [Paenibacillus sp. SC116]|uniref:hypothetical protein n=1 Tax=Paenibacillus sp. SC116 TaxID=2968986 RepID=UPI00215ACACA|nr:hypothetical protein [Paenibacillus sp. SC116]MCR8842725.1 hypothetical protein [Paenibacillus sp. SC116]